MEAVARQFVRKGDNKPVIVRNGWFSFRWTELFESMGIGEVRGGGGDWRMEMG